MAISESVSPRRTVCVLGGVWVDVAVGIGVAVSLITVGVGGFGVLVA